MKHNRRRNALNYAQEDCKKLTKRLNKAVRYEEYIAKEIKDFDWMFLLRLNEAKASQYEITSERLSLDKVNKALNECIEVKQIEQKRNILGRFIAKLLQTNQDEMNENEKAKRFSFLRQKFQRKPCKHEQLNQEKMNIFAHFRAKI